MIIPIERKQRDKFLKFVLDACLDSLPDRAQRYARRRRYFLYGTDSGHPARHNRLYSHLDLVASFLYSPDNARFALAPPEDAEDATVEQVAALGRWWNDEFRNSDLAYQYADALLWSTVYDSMLIKLGWNDARGGLTGFLVDPAHFGVYDESRPSLSDQQAFVHTYAIDHDEAVQRLYRAGLADQVKRMQILSSPPEEDEELIGAHRIVFGGWGQSMLDSVQGRVDAVTDVLPVYGAQSRNLVVRWHELYVWDDRHNDYAVFTLLDPDIVLSDSRETIAILKRSAKGAEYASECNPFLPGEHPFILVQPYPIYNYFWGAAHIERLIPLQRWTDERLRQIQEILARQLDPARVFSGFQGLLDEKAAALGGPGSFVIEQIPGAEVKELRPEFPSDLFAELKEINSVFLEASGLTQTLQGTAGDSARSAAQARQMMITGSGRIRKVAVGLERSLGKLGELALKLVARNSDETIRTRIKLTFLPAQIGVDFNVRIAGHSHSPLFRDETKSDAILMLKAGAIDRESLIDILSPPNAAELKYRLRKRIAAEMAMQAAAAAGNPEDRGKKRPNLRVVG